MSALPPKADINDGRCHVRFVPIADIIDQFVAIGGAASRSAVGNAATGGPSTVGRV